jgi:septal ring factor EnvC (AmiA/AmiB activator)
LEAQAGALRSELQALRHLRTDAAHRRAALAAAAAKLVAKRRKVDRLLVQKKALARATWAEQRRAKAAGTKLAAKARSLRGLLRRIEKDRKKRQATPPRRARPAPRSPLTAPGNLAKTPAKTRRKLALGPNPSISGARGRLTTPVVGRLVARFGRKRAIGTRDKGLSFATAAGARVVAPHGGHVVFAGPFRGYGRLLIIDHGEGYHTLLAGLGRIDVAVNQRLLAGEPIGIMAPSGKGNPRLYLELRRNGRPVDPLPWLAAAPTDKVSG